MESLLKFLNGMEKADRLAFCLACDTSERYLRKAISINQQLGEGLCIRIERESQRQVCCEMLRSDVDWAYLRGTCGCCCAFPNT
jgi:DNA-binding transcriptional regulator YdaS (Cro superfamily)